MGPKTSEPKKVEHISLDLPPFVIYKITDNLEISDILNWAEVYDKLADELRNLNFWKHRYADCPDKNIPRGVLEAINSDKRPIYDLVNEPQRVLTVEMHVIHLNDYYLKIRPHKGVEIVKLFDVCYLSEQPNIRPFLNGNRMLIIHLSSSLPLNSYLFPGLYKVKCRMFVSQPNVDGVTRFKVVDQDNHGSIISKKYFKNSDFTRAQEKFGDDFFFVIIGPFQIEEVKKIGVVVDNDDGYIWKRGLGWHYFEIMRASAKNDEADDVLEPEEEIRD